ncbi:MAG TPA: tungsten ABC transporter substrate-binding protein [Candidatus Hydrogenedentes bacterium]|nr:tungsten ABC transporter substrate-binding protein [Candidatus Hydrogenedentota bacterium]
MTSTSCAVFGLALMVVASGALTADETLTLATTTSTQNSGLLDHIHPDFEAKTGIMVKVIARGTGASLQLAREGNVDVVLVHAPDIEEAFVEEGYGVERTSVMHNDFVLVGPPADPAGVRGSKEVGAALATIAAKKAVFVSRGDNSGTHAKEQALWEATDVPLASKQHIAIVRGEQVVFTTLAPVGDWYMSIGQGMGKTISYATERRAYTLVDRGTYYAFALSAPPRTDLAIVCEGDKRLDNPYSVIAVNPAKVDGVRFDAATRYINWLVSEDTQRCIGDFKVGGKALFHPDVLPEGTN